MSAEDSKYLKAAAVLMEELNFSRAARKLGIGQSALSKRMAALHRLLGYELFVKDGRRLIATPAGEVYAAHAKLAVEFSSRAVTLSKAANAEMKVVMQVGKCPYTDPYLLTKLLSLEVPQASGLNVVITSKFGLDLTHDLLNGTLDLAFLTGLPETPRLTSLPVLRQPLYVAMLEEDELAWSLEITQEQLSGESCILFDRQMQPYLYDDFIQKVRPATAPGRLIHHVTTPDEASQLVSLGRGVAVLSQAAAWRIARDGITIRPLAVQDVVLETRLATRSDNHRRIVREVVKALARSLSSDVAGAPAP